MTVISKFITTIYNIWRLRKSGRDLNKLESLISLGMKTLGRHILEMKNMKQYIDLIKEILGSPESTIKEGRNGITISRFGYQMRFDLQKGFPAVTTKKLHLKSVIYENLWFLTGKTNVQYLNDHGVSIWDEWADENGDLGRIYQAQWINWQTPDGRTVNQVDKVISGLKTNPHSRRHIISAWNPGELEQMALEPCHVMYQFYVREENGDKYLDVQIYQRSGDVFLGVPFNTAGYSLLDHMFAQVTGMKPGYVIHTLGDHHLYIVNKNRAEFYKKNFSQIQKVVNESNESKDFLEVKEWIEKTVPITHKADHIPLALEQMAREPRPLGTMYVNPNVKNIYDFQYSDFELRNYSPHPVIKGDVTE